MLQLLLIAVRNLIQHRRRTLLLGVAIGGVTALLVILIELSTGLRSTILSSATTLMTGHVNVAGFYKVTAGQSAPVVTEYEKVLRVVRQTVPEIDFIVERGRGWAKVISDTEVAVDIADNVRVRVVRSMISQVLAKPEPAGKSKDSDKSKDKDAARAAEQEKEESEVVKTN